MSSLQIARRLGGALRPRRRDDQAGPAVAGERVDGWLEPFYGGRLGEIDAACAEGAIENPYARFRGLDDDVWALLLTQQYDRYPHIRALLPDVPEPAFQELWNGSSGVTLASQSRSFYTRLRAAFDRHGQRPLGEASVLDFGCGWGRLTRYLLRDVAPGHLYGCDPVEGILDVCRANRVAATLARSEFRPDRVPFSERFDLAFAFSVFTHLSEPAHASCLRALHAALTPGGILVVTIRPPAYLASSPALQSLRPELGGDLEAALVAPRYLFVPHPPDPGRPQQPTDGQLDYGETILTLAYVRQRWSEWFELLESSVQLEDPHQVVLTLRRV